MINVLDPFSKSVNSDYLHCYLYQCFHWKQFQAVSKDFLFSLNLYFYFCNFFIVYTTSDFQMIKTYATHFPKCVNVSSVKGGKIQWRNRGQLEQTFWRRGVKCGFLQRLDCRMHDDILFAPHTAPDWCQPDKFGTLSFLAFLVVCDRDKMPHVDQQIL